MLYMGNFSEHEMAFLDATTFIVERDWKGRKGIFASKVGISGGYLSEIIGKRKCPKIDKQENIAKLAGFNSLLDFVEFGKTISQEDMVAVIPKTKVQKTSKTAQTTPSIFDRPISNDALDITSTAAAGEPHPQRRKTDLEIQAEKEHQIVVTGFKDKKRMLKLNQMLITLEHRAPEKIDRLEDYLQGLLDGLPEENPLLGNGTEGK